MRYVFRVFYRKSVRKCIQTVSVRNQNLNNNGACARSGYRVPIPIPGLLSPSPQSEGLGTRLAIVWPWSPDIVTDFVTDHADMYLQYSVCIFGL